MLVENGFAYPGALGDFVHTGGVVAAVDENVAGRDEQLAPTLVTREETLIREFLAEHGDIVVKPLDGMGGTSVFRLHGKDFNIGVVIETVTQYGHRTVMAQKFIPEIAKGDKRVLIIDGEPVPYSLARIPKQGETRGNLAAGGWGRAPGGGG